MSLLTPPSTSHRADKENHFPAPGCRVVWSHQNQYHNLSTPPKLIITASASKELPVRSILKRNFHTLLSVPEDKQREITPEPSDPLANLEYLEYPVSKIISAGASLRDVIEGYSILAARLRACVTGQTGADASWPLFQPLRKHNKIFVEAVIRDLGRALVDPGNVEQRSEVEVPMERVMLPSPKNSPRKKKGMTAEQVKYARDLCTTSHAVIKLLALVFTLPAIYNVFQDDQLRMMLTEVLAIPLADDIPTPNARKTCALSIWLLQVQRLPSEVLTPARDRIAYALRRGIDGELGKEGKKGSASDGLKAIHELSIYQPSTFVPPFVELLPSILSNLLAPTLALRTQACHALGGFVIGCTAIPVSYIHTRISNHVAAYLTTLPPAVNKSPTKCQDAPIVRTLRTTLVATDPAHVAQGPVWAMCVLSSLVVLLGPALCTDLKISRIVSALLSLSMRHKKSTIRAIACLMWRCVAWVYFQPPLPADPDEESEVDEDRDTAEECKKMAAIRDSYWKVVVSVVELNAGMTTIALLLGGDSTSDDSLRKMLELLKIMINKGGHNCAEAMETARRLVSFEYTDSEWNTNRMLPFSLFSASPGLLTAEFKTLSQAVRPIFDQTPIVDDVRCLTREEISKDWVFDGFIDIWRQALACLEMYDEADTPSHSPQNDITAVWDGLLKANVGLLQDSCDDAGTSEFAVRAANILIDILQDPNLDLTPKVSSTSAHRPTDPIDGSDDPSVGVHGSMECSNGCLKLKIIRDLWLSLRTTVPHAQLGAAGERLLACLMKNDEDLADSGTKSRITWASLCADVLVTCDVDDLKAFWGYKLGGGDQRWEWSWTGGIRSTVWRSFVEKWKDEGEGAWEGAVVLLGVPFTDSNTWDLIKDDFDLWEDFLTHAINKALDYGVDASGVLDRVAHTISQNQSPTFHLATRAADLLLSHLDMADAREIPDAITEFVNTTMQASYPPEPRSKPTAMWMVRSLVRVMETCPAELLLGLLESVQDGMCIWISDEYESWSMDELAYDIVPLYQTALVSIQSLPQDVDTLERLVPILESVFCGRKDKPSAAESFLDFWASTYGTIAPPSGGWPLRIQRCLAQSNGAPMPHDELEGAISIEVAEHSDQTSCGRGPEPPSTPTFCSLSGKPIHIGMLRPAVFPSPESVSDDGSDDLDIPVAASSPPTTPTTLRFSPNLLRPHKPLSALRSLPPSSPRSPVFSRHTPASSTRAPISHGAGSDPTSKRRKLEEKENEPQPIITSVLDRIVQKSPAWTRPALAPRKRILEDCDDSRPLKKLRCAEGAGSLHEPQQTADTDEENWVHAIHQESGATSVQPVDVAKALPSLKKRKRMIMDGVLVPTLRDVYRQPSIASCSTAPSTPTLPLPSATGPRRLTRSQSLNTLCHFERLSYDTPKRSRRSTGKTPRRQSDPFVSNEASNPSSDDSIVFPIRANATTIAQSPGGPLELSSDDDPHFGQVTPHHLISPALRRARGQVSDPPSDDSDVMPASPSRDMVARRLLRLGSFQASSSPIKSLTVGAS